MADVKLKIEAERVDFPSEGQKLICRGLILKDTVTVAEFGFGPTDTLVCMVTKSIQVSFIVVWFICTVPCDWILFGLQKDSVHPAYCGLK
jgi:hypothetical protein